MKVKLDPGAYMPERAHSTDAVPVKVIESWLCEIAFNNTGNYLCDACEEIIKRLDGLVRYNSERRDGEQESERGAIN